MSHRGGKHGQIPGDVGKRMSFLGGPFRELLLLLFGHGASRYSWSPTLKQQPSRVTGMFRTGELVGMIFKIEEQYGGQQRRYCLRRALDDDLSEAPLRLF
jgi:hypothetical protein